MTNLAIQIATTLLLSNSAPVGPCDVTMIGRPVDVRIVPTTLARSPHADPVVEIDVQIDHVVTRVPQARRWPRTVTLYYPLKGRLATSGKLPGTIVVEIKKACKSQRLENIANDAAMSLLV